jgi:hypothetical protein
MHSPWVALLFFSNTLYKTLRLSPVNCLAQQIRNYPQHLISVTTVHAMPTNLLNPLKPKLVKSTYEFSPYLKENTTLHHYKDQFINAI